MLLTIQTAVDVIKAVVKIKTLHCVLFYHVKLWCITFISSLWQCTLTIFNINYSVKSLPNKFLTKIQITWVDEQIVDSPSVIKLVGYVIAKESNACILLTGIVHHTLLLYL